MKTWKIQPKAQYPKIEEYDPVLIESSEYLAETVRDMRLKLKDRLTVKKGKKPVEGNLVEILNLFFYFTLFIL